MSVYEKLSLSISIFALAISLVVYFKNKLYSSASLEAAIFSQISSAKTALTSSIEDAIVFKEDCSPLAIHEKNNAYSAQEDLIKAYEFACQHYFSGAVKQNHFEDLFTTEIMQLFTDDTYRKIIGSGTYSSLKRFYKCKQNHI